MRSSIVEQRTCTDHDLLASRLGSVYRLLAVLPLHVLLATGHPNVNGLPSRLGKLVAIAGCNACICMACFGEQSPSSVRASPLLRHLLLMPSPSVAVHRGAFLSPCLRETAGRAVRKRRTICPMPLSATAEQEPLAPRAWLQRRLGLKRARL